MSKVLTFSRVFPAYHPKAGQPTFFVEKICNSFLQEGYSINEIDELCMDRIGLDESIDELKNHTIRAGNRFKVGDKFSPRIWSGKPYKSKQIVIAEDIEVKKVWDVEVDEDLSIWVCVSDESKAKSNFLHKVAKNDGLLLPDLLAWFNKPMVGQIICWNDKVEY